MDKYCFEGKTEEEAKDLALQELNCQEEDIVFSISETAAKLFKAKKYQITVVKKEDIKQFIKNYFHTLGDQMGLELQIELREQENTYFIALASSNNPILIGKEGRTLNALESLVRQSCYRQIGMPIRISLDASGYKEKKRRNFEYEIKKLARDVATSQIATKLDPMNSYERRIVHSIVSEIPHLTTTSSGEEPNRYITIEYQHEQ